MLKEKGVDIKLPHRFWLLTMSALFIVVVAGGVPSELNAASYQNNAKTHEPSFGQVVGWRVSRLWKSRPARKHYFPKPHTADLALIYSDSPLPRITWIGHSTLLIQYNNTNILTDPQFSDTASPVSWAGPERAVAPAIQLADLPPIDMVLISHNHYDHLDIQSVEYIDKWLGRNSVKPKFYVPMGLKSWFDKRGITNVVELEWWQSETLGEWQVYATPVKHHSGRGAFDKNKSHWAGWAVKHPEFSFFFAGDTGYSADFKQIGDTLGPFDFAGIPIGGYAPRALFNDVHVDPEQAVAIFRDIQAKKSVAIHWGTFAEFTDEPFDEPPQRLLNELTRQQLSPMDFEVINHGESRVINIPTNEK